MRPLLLPPDDVPVLGEVQVVPPRRPAGLPAGASTWTAPALRRIHRTTENRAKNKIRLNRVSTVSGDPPGEPEAGDHSCAGKKGLNVRPRSPG